MLAVLGTRPEAIKLAPVVQALREKNLETQVCVTGQHREMLDQVLEVFNIHPDFDLNVMRTNQSPLDVAARTFQGLGPLLEKLKPDWLLLQGDTITTVAAAWVGFYQRTPIGHVEAGLRTGDKLRPFPEEMNRKITTVLADMHFAPSKGCVETLLKEGVPAERILLTGNTVLDALSSVLKRPVMLTDPALKNLQGPFILVTAHRRGNFGRPLEQVCQAILELAASYPEMKIVFPVHRNPQVRKTVFKCLSNRLRIVLLDPLPYPEFVHLMKRARLILTDSGGIQEEALSLGIPVLVLLEVTERTEALETGWAELVGTCEATIVARAAEWLQKTENEFPPRVPNPYGDGAASLRISEFLQSCETPCLTSTFASRRLWRLRLPGSASR